MKTIYNMMADNPENEKKKKFYQTIKVKEGRITRLSDGWANTWVGIARTFEEFFQAPVRIAGRFVDGAFQGAKQGIELSNSPVEATTKGIFGGLVGSVKGTIKGAKATGQKLGQGFVEIGYGIKKIGDSLIDQQNQLVNSNNN